jgi:predicted amidophosphoribosyltransferase
MQPLPPGYGAAPQAPSTSIWICRQCGVVAPLQGSACEVCKQPLDSVRAASPAERVDQVWVAVRCGFTCNSCRFLAPLDALDADGAVECAHCGLRQRFEVDRWREALEFAHGVGDLSGPGPEGRNPDPVFWIGSENPHANTGITRTFEQATFGSLAIDASPGHPVCGRCREPLALSARPGAVDTRCPRCGDQATHTISSAAVDLCPALVAAVSEEHRSDRPKARATATAAGVVALSCPSCGAPLELTEAGTVHTCRYCRASCIVPHQSVARALARTPEPAVWWLYFQGLSAERRRLLASPDGSEAGPGAAARKLLQLARQKARLSDVPGVYETPERPGFNWLQLAVTVGLGAVALLIGLVLATVAVGYDVDFGSLGH